MLKTNSPHRLISYIYLILLILLFGCGSSRDITVAGEPQTEAPEGAGSEIPPVGTPKIDDTKQPGENAEAEDKTESGTQESGDKNGGDKTATEDTKATESTTGQPQQKSTDGVVDAITEAAKIGQALQKVQQEMAKDSLLIKTADGKLVALELKDGKANRSEILNDGTKLTDAKYSKDDKAVTFGRFTNENKDSILMRKSGIYIIELNSESKWVEYELNKDPAPLYNKLNELNMDLTKATFYKGDFVDDGMDELIAIYNESLVLFKIEKNELVILKGYNNDNTKKYNNNNIGTDVWFGEWDFITNQTIEAVGDYDGDGKDEFIIKSGWGIGIIDVEKDYSLKSIFLSPHSVSGKQVVFPLIGVGDWEPKSSDKIIPLGNFFKNINEVDDEFLFQSSSDTFGIFNLNSQNNISSTFPIINGSILSVGDYDGDKLVDILYNENSTLKIKSSNNNFNKVESQNGSKFFTGNESDWWVLDFSTNTFHSSGDFNGDGKDEFVIKSGWGFGIIGLDKENKKFETLYLNSYKNEIDGLTLSEKDTFIGVGRLVD